MSEIPKPYSVDPIIRAIPSDEELKAIYGTAQNAEAEQPHTEIPTTYAIRHSNGELQDGWTVDGTVSAIDSANNKIVTGYLVSKLGIGPDGEQVLLEKEVSTTEFIHAQQQMAEQKRQNEATERSVRASGVHLLGRTATNRLKP